MCSQSPQRLTSYSQFMIRKDQSPCRTPQK
ncbi:unnamed protein product [Notodromas monacha]|uniref:Uncharacterized protein n=1 Tax=Notodromas monacha TaxID=399045 RepID=A0A7R9C1E7_9CRUS|nr:unnamed protein product [Notodromas monacha]CAG0925640.1 unnamed protein product [Notodromas monacha]